MPVYKFRSVEDMPRNPGKLQLDPARIRVLWRRVRRLAPPLSIRRGVTRFRSIEEANQMRENATIARLRSAKTAHKDPK